MMTTPRVTEIPVPMARVEPDPFIGASSRASVAQQRLVEREAREPGRTLSSASCAPARPGAIVAVDGCYSGLRAVRLAYAT